MRVFNGELAPDMDFGLAQTGFALAIPIIEKTRTITTMIGTYFFMLILLLRHTLVSNCLFYYITDKAHHNPDLYRIYGA
jgi:hypothetical protein